MVLLAGSLAERKAARKLVPGADVVVTSYSLVERAETRDILAPFAWQVLVLDEAHGLKNAASLRFRNVMALQVRGDRGWGGGGGGEGRGADGGGAPSLHHVPSAHHLPRPAPPLSPTHPTHPTPPTPRAV